METARRKVTEISQFTRARGKNGGQAHGPLDDCRDISVARLGEALGESLGLLVGQLVGMAERAAGLDLYHLYMDALELARDRPAAIGESFREHFLWRFNREARREGGRCADGLNAELSLLEPDDLEETLAAGSLANAIFNACSEELFGLGKRMGLLINDPDLIHGDNPLGPETIGAAVMEALESQEAPIKVRLLLVSLLSRHLPERVRDIYREINRKLVERNVLPTIRVGMQREASIRTPSGVAAGSAAAGAGDAMAAAGGDLFGLIQKLMGGATGTVGGFAMPGATIIPGPALPGEAPAMNEALPVLRPGTFLYTLNQIQHGQAEGLAGVDAGALAAGQANVLRDLRGGMAGMMTPVDTMTLDIVTMVFDYIFADERIPDAIKALIGRLQIPVLKVAMLDKSFFSQRQHPARRLLDELAEAALGWNPEEGHEAGLYRKIEELVDAIHQGFEDDFAVFENASADLQGFLDEEGKSADRRAALSALTLRSREVADIGDQMAHDEVASCLAGRPVPAAIRAFLNDHWSVLLGGLYQKVGIDSETWKGALATMRDLVWSVAPKADAESRRRLVEMLPGLLKRLDEGVGCLGLTEADRNAFFSTLVKCHAEAVKAGMSGQGEPEAEPAIPADDFPVLVAPQEFQPVEPAADLVEQAGAEEVAAQVWEEGEDASPVRSGDALASLKRGNWIAYRLDDGTEVRAKLSWVSPLKGIYLFTNRQGLRAMSINAEGLAAKLAAGEVTILDATPLMDRAVDNLLETLQRNAA